MAIVLDRRAISSRLAAIMMLCLLAPPGIVMAQTGADQLFREGTEAFKAGRYETALAKFRAAENAGKSGALIQFNLGVTHYKLRNYRLAELAFERAAEDPKLTALAYYNLGLTHKATGDTATARSWFEAAWEYTDNESLRELSTRAMLRLSERQRRRAAKWRKPQSYDGKFDFFAVTKLGTDDNVFRTPNEDYIDLSDPALPLVTPVPQSGEFVRLDVGAKARYPSSKGTGTMYGFTYRGSVDYYVDSVQDNANEYSQKIAFNAAMPFGDSPTSSKVFSNRLFLGMEKDTNFDPDDGIERVINGENLSDRYTYGSYGLQMGFDHDFRKFGYGFDAKAEFRDYEEVFNVADYDYELYLVGTHFAYEFLKNTEFKIAGQYYIREYQERVARNLNGDLIVTNPQLEYTYMSADASLRYRLNSAFRIKASFKRTLREDNFEGYADYTKDRIKLTITISPGDRFRLDLSVLDRTYDFDNAFAYHDPAGGPLELDGLEGSLIAQYRFAKHWSIWAEVEYWDVSSTDIRNQYDRTRSMLGMKWGI